MANALTAVRLLVVNPFAFFMAKGDRGSAIFALVAWVVALITDILDGSVARRRGTVASALHRFRGADGSFRVACTREGIAIVAIVTPVPT
jgi:phosphatidylserine synthase